jgi:arginine decarboxylase
MDAGADSSSPASTKMGAGIEQSSAFHLQGDLVDPAVLKSREDLLGTASPSSLVYGALGGWRRQMVEHGQRLLDAALALAYRTRAAIAALPGLTAWAAKWSVPVAPLTSTPSKSSSTSSTWVSASTRPAEWLCETCHVDMGLADHPGPR